eukprot:Gregarina_sp_Poly_1__549@NODE_1131_length_4993_cov_135_826431_g78_i1_p4_GENE_NODE_1131_length_4993_cov_135_826431_g78_i1NODE_1131_length_4993_cov_135_826431_g78_i1_p4_ORF_typecomplete_len141_score7_90MGC24/PF05283_11/0_19MGC24/PF05283_11/3_6e03_NODE_1131_length_4993_cov_135_826431_g78_i192514
MRSTSVGPHPEEHDLQPESPVALACLETFFWNSCLSSYPCRTSVCRPRRPAAETLSSGPILSSAEPLQLGFDAGSFLGGMLALRAVHRVFRATDWHRPAAAACTQLLTNETRDSVAAVDTTQVWASRHWQTACVGLCNCT